MLDNQLEDAFHHGERAFRLLSPGKPTHAFVAATRYRQGWIRQMQERYEDSLKHLQQALEICQFNEISNGYQAYAGATARCKWRISQVLKRLGRSTEAEFLLEEAESTKKQLYSSGLFLEREDEVESWDSLVALLFR